MPIPDSIANEYNSKINLYYLSESRGFELLNQEEENELNKKRFFSFI